MTSIPENLAQAFPTIRPDGHMVAPAVQWHALPRRMVLENGNHILGGQLAYETWGDPRANNGKPTLIFSGMSSGCHVASSTKDLAPGWWEDAIGIDCPLDVKEHFLICVSNFGSCFGSTGPASVNAETDRIYGHEFPDITIRDQVRAVVHLLEELGVDHLQSVIGLSMGGTQALALLQEFSGGSTAWSSFHQRCDLHLPPRFGDRPKLIWLSAMGTGMLAPTCRLSTAFKRHVDWPYQPTQ